jgi:hypothetical protein
MAPGLRLVAAAGSKLGGKTRIEAIATPAIAALSDPAQSHSEPDAAELELPDYHVAGVMR